MSRTDQSLAERAELRRFVGRELLLFLWLESELFEGTLPTKEHGEIGLWLEGRLVLDRGRESTIIKGGAPGAHRDAKEALLAGKSPERAGLHLTFGGRDCALTLRGDTLAFAGLSAPKEEAEPAAPALDAPPPPPRRRRRVEDDAPDDAEHEALYERMQFAREVEDLVTGLYRDFLTLRLSSAWGETVLPALGAWAAGDEVDVERYRAARSRALAGKGAPAARRR